MLLPLQYQGEGQFTTPRGFAKRCDQTLVIGEVLQWEQLNERSAASHKHYFATIADAWANLPEAQAADFPNPETLRKHALIKAGYCTVARVVCADNPGAIALCALMQAMDSYAICEMSGRVVTVYRAQSQSMRAMGKKAFQESKERTLHVISSIIGVDIADAA
jgi:hypothetical protein